MFNKLRYFLCKKTKRYYEVFLYEKNSFEIIDVEIFLFKFTAYKFYKSISHLKKELRRYDINKRTSKILAHRD